MKLDDAVELLISTFGAIPIKTIEEIDQNGIYLYFEGLKKELWANDTASFALVVASNTFSHDTNSAIDTIVDVRKKLLDLSKRDGRNWFREVKAASFEGSMLYLHAVMLDVDISFEEASDEF